MLGYCSKMAELRLHHGDHMYFISSFFLIFRGLSVAKLDILEGQKAPWGILNFVLVNI